MDTYAKIKQYFRENKDPYYFISPTNFNLINLDQWVNCWININFIDCFDQSSSAVIIPTYRVKEVLTSLEQINLYLLKHKETLAQLNKVKETLSSDQQIRLLFLFFNPSLEKIADQYDYKIQLPSYSLVNDIDNKITTTKIGNEAGVLSVPNVLVSVKSYQQLCGCAKEAQLGHRLVVQTAYGDSGKTTFFIENQSDYDRVSKKIENAGQVKVMKRINCQGAAIEACVTQSGTYVGMLMSELIGFQELTPYKAGWCGNELHQQGFNHEIRACIHIKTEQLGAVLYERGYRGYFEVDYLIDRASGAVYLGELNPRITGVTTLTNTSSFCQRTIPLFLFHLLEYRQKDIGLSACDYNAQTLAEGAEGMSSQMILKHTDPTLKKIDQAPVSGVYRLNGQQQLQLVKASHRPTDRGQHTDHAYVLRIMKTNDYAYYGGDMAIIFLNTGLTDHQGSMLNSEAKKWNTALRQAFHLRDLTTEEQNLLNRYTPTGIIKE